MLPKREAGRPGVELEHSELVVFARYSVMAARLIAVAHEYPMFATSLEVGKIIEETDQYKIRDSDLRPLNEKLFDCQLQALRPDY
jgi:hypothetical protein